MRLPKKGIYRHYKGKRYELMDIARHSETMEPMVVYRALYGEGTLWVRPLKMWSEPVEMEGSVQPRFALEEESARDGADEHGFAQMEPPPEFSWAEMGCFEEPVAGLPACTEDVSALLKRVFGYDSFRDGQREIVEAILEGKDTLAILPTGGGKSICYQLPALKLEGVALVVSPLISLMKDQVEALLQLGIPAAYLNSSLTERQFNAALKNMAQGKYRIVYIAPERLLTERFLRAALRVRISMLAVDEAHCISQWGHDFRPSYLSIPQFWKKLPSRPRICAFTATATEQVRRDIVQILEMESPFVHISSFNRSELYFSVIHTQKKEAKLLELLESYRGFPGIIYCGTRKNVEAVCDSLLKRGYSATRYHAGLPEEERSRNQDDFIYDRALIMVATNAFGMGIDKSNVRFVIHYNMPKDIESYYQEAGRAGRDGERADCHLLFEPKDIILQKFFIDKMGEELELDQTAIASLQKNARVRLRAMANYSNTAGCLRGALLRYFGETSPQTCGFCSNCLSPQSHTDVTPAARLVVGLIQERREQYGIKMTMDILLGNSNARIAEGKLNQSAYFGALRGMGAKNARFVLDALLDSGFLYQSDEMYPVLRCTEQVSGLMDGTEHLYARQEATVTRRREKLGSGANLPEDVDRQLFEQLRQLRMQISRTRSVPPYVICSDATLIDMCREQPTNLQDMRFVRGMGERKIQSIGEIFVRAIIRYREENNG